MSRDPTLGIVAHSPTLPSTSALEPFRENFLTLNNLLAPLATVVFFSLLCASYLYHRLSMVTFRHYADT